MLQSVLDTVEDEGADAGLVRPCDGEFSLYSGYRLCLNLERCVIKGSMQGTYAKPLEANAVILETPVNSVGGLLYGTGLGVCEANCK